MARGLPSVVPLEPEDPEAFSHFAQIWVSRRVASGLSAEGARRAVADGRLAEVAFRDHVIVLLAYHNGEYAGYAWTTKQPWSANLDAPSMSIDDLFVLPEYRGNGVGRSLLAAAASTAQRGGVEQITCSVPSQARDANRALARLGFAAAYTRRVAPTNGLLRRLRGPEQHGTIDQVLIQRRRRLSRSRALAEGSALAR
ncbi:GNAT family N-acetyltransferase [Gephyromycinifex aptenodytis]|uniref:GNAT family N-acetyltransferase n=1 Tax=Gephyromycinifex aptenodytis TaxID=2716227 RepID=UPI0014478C39|nr:GNAT family N-acetyltransferase [Gephyromycinifex aptenodytis]